MPTHLHLNKPPNPIHGGFSTCLRPLGPTSSKFPTPRHTALCLPLHTWQLIALDLHWHPQGAPGHTCRGPRCSTMNTWGFDPWSQACSCTQILMHTHAHRRDSSYPGRCRKELNRINCAHEVQGTARYMCWPAANYPKQAFKIHLGLCFPHKLGHFQNYLDSSSCLCLLL